MPTFVQGRPPATARSVLVLNSRVRVLKVKNQTPTITGLVESVDAERVMIASDRGVVGVPLASITAIDVKVGTKRHTLWGLVAGAGLGVVLGLNTSIDAPNCGSRSFTYCSRGGAVGGATVFMGAVGAVVGAFITTDRWERRFSQPAGR